MNNNNERLTDINDIKQYIVKNGPLLPLNIAHYILVILTDSEPINENVNIINESNDGTRINLDFFDDSIIRKIYNIIYTNYSKY